VTRGGDAGCPGEAVGSGVSFDGVVVAAEELGGPEFIGEAGIFGAAETFGERLLAGIDVAGGGLSFSGGEQGQRAGDAPLAAGCQRR
jgi:hypothetical protein